MKNVGVVKLNLGETIDSSESIRKRLRIDKLNPAYGGYVEISMKSTLVASSAPSDTLSQMSDVLSVDSGVDSDFDIDDFEEESKGAGNKGERKSGRKPATIINT